MSNYYVYIERNKFDIFAVWLYLTSMDHCFCLENSKWGSFFIVHVFNWIKRTKLLQSLTI